MVESFEALGRIYPGRRGPTPERIDSSPPWGSLSLKQIFQASRRLSLPVQLAGALVAVSLVGAVELAMPAVALHYPFLLFFASNAINGVLWRRRVAVASVLMAAAFANLVIMEPRGTLLLDGPTDWTALGIFVTIGICEVLVLSALINLSASLEATLDRARRAESSSALLFAESNHRIKNNLQLIATFLNVEARAAARPEIAAALNGAITRLLAVGQIHDQLSHANGEHVDLDTLIAKLCEQLNVSSLDGQRIVLDCESSTQIVLPSRTATKLGLLVNELTTNAIKHAFPGATQGSVHVWLRREDKHIVLTVQDDRRGFDGKMVGSGRRFIDALASELNGSIAFAHGSGTKADVRIPLSSVTMVEP